MIELVISRELADQMVMHCKSCYPNEACGIVAGTGNRVTKVYPMPNTEPSPVSYLMDPGEQFGLMKELRQEGLSMLAIFHSHPQSPAYPSAKDVSLAFYDDVVYVIVGLTDPEAPEIRAYTIVDGAVEYSLFDIVR
ncbi:MAG: M67 family metallopeptidase [Nitrospirae bacterium]|nr:M67 family metallopeptidase [Nitrospirota bacterium]